MTTKITKTEETEAAKITAIYWPWIEAMIQTDQVLVEITLSTGRVVYPCWIPLGAAVEIEKAGWTVKVVSKIEDHSQPIR
jgi:hypothetical protein